MEDLGVSAGTTNLSKDATTAEDVRKRAEGRGLLSRTFYVGAGSLFVAFGVAGMFLPLVPTTIFLILAAACYGRSSPRAYRWLTTNRFFGNYLRNYQEHRGATVRAKSLSIATLWLGIGATIAFVALPLFVDVVLLLIAAGVTWHLLRLRTICKTESGPAR